MYVWTGEKGVGLSLTVNGLEQLIAAHQGGGSGWKEGQNHKST